MDEQDVAGYWQHEARSYDPVENPLHIWEILLLIAEQTPGLFCGAVQAAATAIGTRFCTHATVPGPLPDIGPLSERRTAAQQHAGLCGRYHAEYVANIDLAAIEERTGGAQISTKNMRNQVTCRLLLL